MRLNTYYQAGFKRTDARDRFVQIDSETWIIARWLEHPETGNVVRVTLSTIRELRDDEAYTITYPIPRPVNHPGKHKGTRVYQINGTLDEAIRRGLKAARRV